MMESDKSFLVKTLELGGDIYENVEFSSREELVQAIEQHKIIAMWWNNKKIYVNASYIVSFKEVE